MALVAQQVQVQSEVLALFEMVAGIVADLKAKKATAAIATDALPQFMQVLSGISALSADWADKADFENTVALGLAKVLQAL